MIAEERVCDGCGDGVQYLSSDNLCDGCIAADVAAMGNPPAVGAPKGWRWGYLPCGCRNDGYGRHIR